MNELQGDIVRLFKTLRRHHALDHLVLIGSWTTLCYQGYFKGADYHPVIRTTDIDFLVPKKPPRGTKINISKVMADEGFIEKYSHDGWVTYHKPEFHVEFLMSRVGPKPETPLSLPQLGITVRPLRHMWLLTDNLIQVPYAGIRLHVPHPAAYGLHKLIIAARRRNKEKQARDREQARAVLAALSKKDRQLLNEIYRKLSKKEHKVVSEQIERDPLLHGIIT